MGRLLVTEPIAAPPERVWSLATDLSGVAERVTAIEAIEVLTEGPFGVGTRWRETRTMMGRQAIEELEITAVEPGRSYTAEAESCGCRYVSTLTCDAEGEGTLVTWSFEGKPVTTGARVMMTLMAPLNWMMTRQVREALAGDLADLRRAAEA